jgi:hypothetical protein
MTIRYFEQYTSGWKREGTRRSEVDRGLGTGNPW